MDSKTKLISDAGRRYQKQNDIRPLNTRDRLRMYNSIQVSPSYRKQAQRKTSFGTVDRDYKDSFVLRHNKQMVINTNYHINDEQVYTQSRRQGFLKGQFTRIIGDVRDEDYSLPLVESSDKRCSDAFITLSYQDTIVTPQDTHKARAQKHHLNFQKQLSREKLNLSLDMKKVNSIKSTMQSERGSFLQQNDLLKKRNKRQRNLQLHDTLKKIRYFDHDIGHKYGQSLFVPKKVPQFYDVQKSKQQLIKKSMSSPKGHVRFGSYREKIATRLDRADPYWGMTINYQHTQNPEWNQARTVKMEKILQRRLNEVYSKYPLRQNMNLITPKNYSPQKV